MEFLNRHAFCDLRFASCVLLWKAGAQWHLHFPNCFLVFAFWLLFFVNCFLLIANLICVLLFFFICVGISIARFPDWFPAKSNPPWRSPRMIVNVDIR